MSPTAVAESPEPAARSHEVGYEPLSPFARIRRPSGYPALDEDGEVLVDEAGNPKPCQHGELVDLKYWRSNLARLALAQTTILPVSREAYEKAPRCPHGRVFASAELSTHCACTVAAKVTSL